MRYSELKGRAVVSLGDAKKIGEVDDLLVETTGHRIMSLKVKSGLFSSARLVPVEQVKNVGPDAVTIVASEVSADTQVVSPESIAESGPAHIALSSIIGNKVVTDAGTMVGEVRDVIFDWVALTVTGYEAREGGLFAKGHEFAATPDVRYGEKIITIPAQLLNRPA